MDQKDGFLRESTGECLSSALIVTIPPADRSAANTLIDTDAAEHGYEHFFIRILEPFLKKNRGQIIFKGVEVLNG